MALHEHIHIQWYFKPIRELFDPCSFALAAAIGEKYEGDLIGLEVGEGTMGSRERIRATEEDAINAMIMSASQD